MTTITTTDYQALQSEARVHVTTPKSGKMVWTNESAGRVLVTPPGAAPSDRSTEMHEDSPIPVGLCQCGCGQRTPLATHTNRAQGKVKGQPTPCMPGHRRMTPRQRFMVKVSIEPSGCWRWVGYIDKNTGYGRVAHQPKQTTTAHRASYELFIGPIPDGHWVDHLCRNRWCVNPEHLETVLPRENTMRGSAPAVAAYKAGTCQRGHSNAEHAYFRDGQRICCRTCEAENQRRRRARRHHG